MMPLFLQSLMGYTAESAGLVLSGGGLLLLFMMPVVGVLSSKVQARYLIAFGWLTLSVGMYYSTRQLDLDISFRSASMLRLVQVFGLGFLFVPINLASYVGMPIGEEQQRRRPGQLHAQHRQQRGNVDGHHADCATRAVSSSVSGAECHIGTAQRLPTRLRPCQRIWLRSGVDANRAAKEAYALIYRTVIVQATTLAYVDTFLVLAGMAAIMFVLSFALKKNEPGGAGWRSSSSPMGGTAGSHPLWGRANQ